MTISKASYSEWQNLMDFANEYEELTPRFSLSPPSNEELGQLLRKYNPQFFRTVFGYATLLDVLCDPNDNTLALNKEISEILEKAGYQLKEGAFFSKEE